MASRTTKLMIRQASDDDETTFQFMQVGKAGAIHVHIDGTEVPTPAGVSGVLEAAAATCGALHVGSGITTIQSSWLSHDDLMAKLTFGEECDGDDWAEWIEDSELDDRLSSVNSDDFRVGRWRVSTGKGLTRVLTDGVRFLPLRWPGSDSLEPAWEPMFEWSFSNESGGPCIWDGSCSAGLVAPDVLMEIESGDQDPGIRLIDIGHRYVVDVIASIAEYWAVPLIVGWSSLPGLTPDERNAVWGASVDNSQKFSLTCGTNRAAEVVQSLLDSVPGLEEANRALLEPDSSRGRSVYAWLKGLAGSQRIFEQVDWFTIFDALRGEIDGPTPLAQSELKEAARRRGAAVEAER